MTELELRKAICDVGRRMYMKNLVAATDGNISVHARKLEEAGYVSCEKSFKGRMPLTEYKITKQGRAALERYLDHMEALIKAMKNV